MSEGQGRPLSNGVDKLVNLTLKLDRRVLARYRAISKRTRVPVTEYHRAALATHIDRLERALAAGDLLTHDSGPAR